MTRTVRLVALAAIVITPALRAQHDHGRSVEQLGHVVFPTSCNAGAQREFERAMALLHSFWWEQGQAAFQAVVAADSTCAMGYWGLALNAWGNPFVGGPGGNAGKGEALRRGTAFAERAIALGAPTPRERAFLAALGALYRGSDSIPNARRLQAYSRHAGARVSRLSERQRSRDLLRALARGDGVEDRHDVRSSEAGGRDPESALRALPGPPRPGALHHPRERLAAARRARSRCSTSVRANRAVGAARAAHAIAHLCPARSLG